MSNLTPFMISDYTTGLQNNVEPFKLIDDAFYELENMLVLKGKAVKRLNALLIGRLQKPITGEAVGNGSANYTGNIVNTPISLSTITFTDAGGQSITDDGEGNLIGDIDPTGNNTINYLTGAYDVTFLAVSGVVTLSYDYYPLLPVMGMPLRETTTVNVEETMFFDTVDSYTYNQTTKKFVPNTTANNSWTGSDSEFFCGHNYFITSAGVKYFWATNGKAYSLSGADNRDGIKYYNGIAWVTFRPKIYEFGGNPFYLDGAKIIASFKGHLLFMNTSEDGVNFPNRVRASATGDPTYFLAPATETDSFRHDIIGKGSFIDCTTSQSIQSWAIINDKFIVYFERSAYELAYTGNRQIPFIFRSISNEFGSESQFSTQIANGTAITFGQRAITGTDGVRISRIDEKIPDDIFEINNKRNGKERVQSVKDYIDEYLYFSLAKGSNTYPNKMLLFNYKNGSYSYLDDNYTALGLFQTNNEYNWETIGKTWSECAFPWNSAVTNAESPGLIGGNQRGFIHRFNLLSLDDSSLDITAVDVSTKQITCPLHNLIEASYTRIINLLGISGYSEDKIYKVTIVDSNTLKISTSDTLTGTYIGGGSIAILKPFSFKTKKFNPFIDKGSNIKIGYIDLLMDKTAYGKLAINIYGGEDDSHPVVSIEDFSTAYEGFNNFNDNKAWKRIQVNSNATSLQIEGGLTEEMLLSDDGLDIYKSNFTIYAMRLWLSEAGKNIGLL